MPWDLQFEPNRTDNILKVGASKGLKRSEMLTNYTVIYIYLYFISVIRL